MLAGPDIVEAQLLGLDRSAADAVRPGLAANLRQMDSQPHIPSRGSIRMWQIEPARPLAQGVVRAGIAVHAVTKNSGDAARDRPQRPGETADEMDDRAGIRADVAGEHRRH